MNSYELALDRRASIFAIWGSVDCARDAGSTLVRCWQAHNWGGGGRDSVTSAHRVIRLPHNTVNKLTVPKRQGSLGNVGIMGFVFTSRYIFKPITTALRQVTMRGIACTIDRIFPFHKISKPSGHFDTARVLVNRLCVDFRLMCKVARFRTAMYVKVRYDLERDTTLMCGH